MADQTTTEPTTDLVPVQTAVPPTTPTAPTTNVGTINTLSDVYSPSNILQTSTAAISKPDYTDPFNMYQQFLNSPEIQKTKAELEAINNQTMELNQGLRTSLAGFRQSPLSMNAIRGASQAASDTAALPLQALSEQAGAKTAFLNTQIQTGGDLYGIAREERAKIDELIAATGGNAKISYNDSYEKALKKADKYRVKVAKEEKKVAEKDALKSMALQLGINTKGASAKTLRAKISKIAKNDRQVKEAMAALDLKLKQKQVAGYGSSGGSGAAGVIAGAAANLTRGQGGYVDGNKYQAEKDKAVATGKVTPAQFDAQYGYLLSANDQTKFGVSVDLKNSPSLSAAQKEDVATMETVKTLIGQITGQGSKLPGVGALGSGSMSSFLYGNFGIGSDQGEANRNTIGNIAGTIAKLRGGTSFTANEQKLLETYVPTINDSDARIQTKLRGLNDFITEKNHQLMVASGIADTNYGFDDINAILNIGK